MWLVKNYWYAGHEGPAYEITMDPPSDHNRLRTAVKIKDCPFWEGDHPIYVYTPEEGDSEEAHEMYQWCVEQFGGRHH